MTVLIPSFSNGRAASVLQLRGVLARSNSFLIAHTPKAWIFWFAWPHEIWHYLMACVLGVSARLVPGATLFNPTERWKSVAILMAPATVGLIWPLLWLPVLQGGSLAPSPLDWLMAVVVILGWWAGCLGDFIDTWLQITRSENKAQHRARMQSMVGRYAAELAGSYPKKHLSGLRRWTVRLASRWLTSVTSTRA
jgi:hypothetical protein